MRFNFGRDLCYNPKDCCEERGFNNFPIWGLHAVAEMSKLFNRDSSYGKAMVLRLIRWGQGLQMLVLLSVIVGGMVACRGQAEDVVLTETPVSTQDVATLESSAASATFTPAPTFTGTPTLAPTPTPNLSPIPTVVTPTATAAPQTLTPLPSPLPAVSTPITPTKTAVPEALATLIFQSCPRRQACIRNPSMDEVVSGNVQFRGAANRPGFAYYKLEYQLEGSPEWHFLDSFERSVRFATLAHWDTTTVPSGTYRVRLIVVDKNGNYWPEEAWVRLIVVNDEQQKNKDPFEPLRYNPTVTGDEQ
jgi:hypothetical protein